MTQLCTLGLFVKVLSDDNTDVRTGILFVRVFPYDNTGECSGVATGV